MSTDPRTSADDYFDRWGTEGDAALAILASGCDIPPSLEVFEHGLEAARSRAKAPIDIRRYARVVADSYRMT